MTNARDHPGRNVALFLRSKFFNNTNTKFKKNKEVKFYD